MDIKTSLMATKYRCQASFPALSQQQLKGFEKFSVPLCTTIAKYPRLKKLAHLWAGTAAANFVYYSTCNIVTTHGLEALKKFKPPSGVLLVGNHHSFCDMHIASATLLKKTSCFGQPYYPTRSNFFYTTPTGLLINLALSGGAMFPPVFRQSERRDNNRISTEQMVQLLARPNTIIGFHPEGQRNTNQDPYSFLPPKAGIGRLIQSCAPETTILPFFTCGASSNVFHEIKRNFKRDPVKRGPNIRITYGTPLFAKDFDPKTPALKLAQQMMDHIQALGHQDRQRQHQIDKRSVH